MKLINLEIESYNSCFVYEPFEVELTRTDKILCKITATEVRTKMKKGLRLCNDIFFKKKLDTIVSYLDGHSLFLSSNL